MPKMQVRSRIGGAIRNFSGAEGGAIRNFAGTEGGRMAAGRMAAGRIAAGKKKRKGASGWIRHVKAVQKRHPSLTYGEAMIEASKSWR